MDIVVKFLLNVKALAGTEGALAAPEIPAKPVSSPTLLTATAEKAATRLAGVVIFIE
jgi:hypothetical protein